MVGRLGIKDLNNHNNTIKRRLNMPKIALEYVKRINDIKGFLNNFYRDIQDNVDIARMLFTHTTYWIYSTETCVFGPSKFVGFKNMTFSIYKNARNNNCGARFNGRETRLAIESILGNYKPNDKLKLELYDWGSSLIDPYIFSKTNIEKWVFCSLV
jgi:hypothetical protein